MGMAWPLGCRTKGSLALFLEMVVTGMDRQKAVMGVSMLAFPILLDWSSKGMNTQDMDRQVSLLGMLVWVPWTSVAEAVMGVCMLAFPILLDWLSKGMNMQNMDRQDSLAAPMLMTSLNGRAWKAVSRKRSPARSTRSWRRPACGCGSQTGSAGRSWGLREKETSTSFESSWKGGWTSR